MGKVFAVQKFCMDDGPGLRFRMDGDAFFDEPSFQRLYEEERDAQKD